VYITPGKNSLETRDFIQLNLMAYKPKVSDVIDVVNRRGYDEIPIVLVGELNIDLNSTPTDLNSYCLYMKSFV